MCVLGNKRKVFIVNGSRDYEVLFTNLGFVTTNVIDEADLICFTGGSDVSPEYYGEANIASHTNKARDQFEEVIYKKALQLGKHMVGICRGGQFLNVMNGGKMWQDVDNHTRNHLALDILSGRSYFVTSTHHQMMRPTEEARILMTAQESRKKIADKQEWNYSNGDYNTDIECVYYPNTKSLCFQPHPEFILNQDCKRAFALQLARVLKGQLEEGAKQCAV